MVNITNLEDLFGRVIDSYPLSHRDDSVILNAVNEAAGQSFTNSINQVQLTDVVLYLQRNAAFGVAGNILNAILYRATGVVGTTAIPIGAALATSDNVLGNDATLGTSWGLVNFHFTTPFTLEPGQDYVIIIILTASIAGQVEVGTDTSSPAHTGNECDSLVPPAWVANAGTDCIFYLFSYSDVLAGGAVDVTDRAARLLGIVYGSQAQLQQVAGTLELITQDTGLNTNPERWLHDNHWEPTAEIPIVLDGAPGELAVGGAVPAGETRRIREITVRHAGTNNTVVTILDASGGNIKISIPVLAQDGAQWSSQDGREIAATLQPVVQSSDVTGGNTFVSISGVET